MGGSVGLLIGMGGDAGAFQDALRDLQRSLSGLSDALGPAAQKAAGATKPLDDALLNQHQSVHLLLDEFGIHLPRAVVSGIAEMLPNITAFGGVMLAAFAVEKIIEFGKKLNELDAEAEGTAQALKDMAAAAKQNDQIMVEHASHSQGYAKEQLSDINRQIGAQQQYVQKLHNRYEMEREDWGYLATAVKWVIGDLKDMTKADEELRHEEELRAQLSKALIAANDEEIDREKHLLEVHNQVILAGLSGAAAKREETRQAVEQLRIEEQLAIQKSGEQHGSVEDAQRIHDYYETLIHEREVLGQIQLQKETAREIDRGSADALARQLETIRETLSVLQARPGEAEAAEINADIQKQLDAAKREIDADRRLFAEHKITREQMAQAEREYTQIVDALSVERAARFNQEFEKTVAEMGKLKLQMPALAPDFFTPMTDGVRKLSAAEREALPTETEINKVRSELLKVNPDLTKDELAATTQRLLAIPAIRAQIEALGHLKGAHIDLQAEIGKELGIGPEYVSFMNSFTDAAKQANIAAMQDTAAVTEQFTTGLAGLVAGRKAQAGVEAIWETAKGIAMIAEGTWPPNPAALLAAGIHFEAAAQYAILAGSSSRRSAGAGAGSYGSRGAHSGGGGADRGQQMPPQTLAPGAGGAGGRFGSPGSGVVVVHGSSDFHAWIAGVVTEAANRGNTVVATSSQRGAPVGH